MKKKLAVLVSLMLCVMVFAGCGETSNDFENDVKAVASRGIIENDVYKSGYAELSFNLPEDWQFSTDEEISKAFALTEDIVEDADKKFFETNETQALYDMMAVNNVTGANVILMYENLSLSAADTVVTEEMYVDILKNQLSNVATFNYEVADAESLTISGNEYLSFTAKIADMDLEQAYYLRKIDNYMLSIIVTSSNANESIDDIMSHFN